MVSDRLGVECQRRYDEFHHRGDAVAVFFVCFWRSGARPRATLSSSSAESEVYKGQVEVVRGAIDRERNVVAARLVLHAHPTMCLSMSSSWT